MNKCSQLITAVAIGMLTLSAFAATDTGTAPAAPPHHRMMMHHSPFMTAVNQLGLTDAQRQSIHGIMEKAHAQEKSDMASHKGEFSGFMSPGDPNYANAVQAAKDASVARIQQRSDEDTQIYNLLTPEQQAKLPQVLQKMKDHMKQHKGDWKGHHDHGTATSSSSSSSSN